MGGAGEGRLWTLERRLRDITATLRYVEGGKLSPLPTPRPACLIEPHKNGNLIELALRLLIRYIKAKASVILREAKAFATPDNAIS
jgi:hypothetical protein